MTPSLDLSNARHEPWAHQREGAERIFSSAYLGLLDQPRLGKSAQVVNAACALWRHGRQIRRVLILCPAANRGETWFDPELGQIAEHLWDNVPSVVVEYHRDGAVWRRGCEPGDEDALQWVVTNYEWLRTGLDLNKGTRKRTPLYERAVKLAKWAGEAATMVVADESSALANHKAAQTRMAKLIRRKCARAVILNGTPMGHAPVSLYSQADFLDPAILDCPTMTHFKSRYCVMGGHEGRQIVRYVNLEDLTARLAPHVLARKRSDCMDLPPQLPIVTLQFPLSEATWRKYKAMKDDMVAWLDDKRAATASQAFVKSLRLSQLTSGLAGGIEILDDEDDLPPEAEYQASLLTELDKLTGDAEAYLDGLGGQFAELERAKRRAEADMIDMVASLVDPSRTEVLGRLAKEKDALLENEGWELSAATFRKKDRAPKAADTRATPTPVEVISTERLDFFMGWLKARLELEPNLRLIVWCRFRPELDALWAALNEWRNESQLGPSLVPSLAKVHGGQKKAERRAALSMVHPKTARPGPFVFVGTERTGGAGLNMAAANAMAYYSNDRSLNARMQSYDRPCGIDQVEPIAYFDLCATGPKGQHTIDHVVVRALKAGETMAEWTVSQWRKALAEE